MIGSKFRIRKVNENVEKILMLRNGPQELRPFCSYYAIFVYFDQIINVCLVDIFFMTS